MSSSNECLTDDLFNELRELKRNAITKRDLSDVLNVLFDPKDCKKTNGLVSKIQLLCEYLLKNLYKICEKLDIKFWLHGGTLLGSARNGDFVPWDDDIDLGIMREDLRKLREYLEKTDTPFAVKKFFFIPKFYSFQERFVFKDQNIPVYLDLFVYDHCDISKKDNLWQDYLTEREHIKQQLIKTEITSNSNDKIDDKKNEEIVVNILNDSIKKYNCVEKSTGIFFGIEHGLSHFPRIYSNDFIFPLTKLKFCSSEYYAPKKWREYLTNQYYDWERFPEDIGCAKHIYNYTHQNLNDIHQLIEKLELNKKRVGYTAGAFDMFHSGHLNLLKQSKENCEKLIVGITTDELIIDTKKKKPIVPFWDRLEIVRACKYVDEVVIQSNLDKVKAWEILRYDVLFSGDDWQNNPRWIKYQKKLGKHGIPVVFFPYTKNLNSSKLAKILNELQDE